MLPQMPQLRRPTCGAKKKTANASNAFNQMLFLLLPRPALWGKAQRRGLAGRDPAEQLGGRAKERGGAGLKPTWTQLLLRHNATPLPKPSNTNSIVHVKIVRLRAKQHQWLRKLLGSQLAPALPAAEVQYVTTQPAIISH